MRARFADWGSDGHSPTWISWAELERVDWSEPAERVDARIHEYRRTPGGWVMSGKAARDPRVAERIGLPMRRDPGRLSRYGAHDWPEGTG